MQSLLLSKLARFGEQNTFFIVLSKTIMLIEKLINLNFVIIATSNDRCDQNDRNYKTKMIIATQG